MTFLIGFVCGAVVTLGGVCLLLLFLRGGSGKFPVNPVCPPGDEFRAEMKDNADQREAIIERARKNPANRTMWD